MKAQVVDSVAVTRGDSLMKYKLVVVHDTVYVPIPEAKMPVDSSRIIYTKPVGRYDRGITNYRFIPKNKWIGGVTVSVFNFESDNSRLLFSLLKDIDLNLRTLSVKPFVGYAIKDNTHPESPAANVSSWLPQAGNIPILLQPFLSSRYQIPAYTWMPCRYGT